MGTRSGCGALHLPRDLDPRGDAELVEDVAQVRLDRLRAEEELARDLGVRPPVDHQAGDLELAGGQRADAVAVAPDRPRAALDALPEAAQLLLGLGAVARGSVGVERGCRTAQLGRRAVALARQAQR